MTHETASTAPVYPADPPPPGSELSSVRTVAEKWLASTMTLFGLLSFSAFFFGAETLKVFEGHEEWRSDGFKLLLVGAVLSATLCTFFGTRAAHGWPPRLFPTAETKQKQKQKQQPQNQERERRSAQEKIDQARKDLKIAMGVAAIAVVLILTAVLVVFDAQLSKPAPLTVKVLAPGTIDNVLVCGKYATADAKGISVTDGNGSLKTTPWTEVGKVAAVRSC